MEHSTPKFNLNNSIVEKIKEYRKSKDFTQKDFSELINVSPSVYSRIESGEKELTLNFVQHISETTKMNLSEMFDFTGTSFHTNTNKGLLNQCSNPTLHINLNERQFEDLKELLK